QARRQGPGGSGRGRGNEFHARVGLVPARALLFAQFIHIWFPAARGCTLALPQPGGHMKRRALIAAFVVACLAAAAPAQNCELDWSPAGGTVPTARTGAAMAYDAARGRLVLFGGQRVGGS